MQSSQRLGMLHSDGSITVFSPDIGIEKARDEALDFDSDQDDPTSYTRLVLLCIKHIEEIETPSLEPARH